MKISLTGRVALVTGASRGIGRAIALALAEAGADVAVNYRREDAAANEVVAAIEKMGRKARAYRAPVDDFEAVAAMVDAVARDFGSIGILVNNAGIASRGQSVADTDPARAGARDARARAGAAFPLRPRAAASCARKRAATSS